MAFFAMGCIVLFAWAWMNAGVVSAGWVVLGFFMAACGCALVSTVLFTCISKTHSEENRVVKPASNDVDKVDAACQCDKDVFFPIETQS